MNHAVRRGNEEPVEVLAQLLNLIAPCHAVHFQKGCGGFRVVCLQFQPDIWMTQVRDLVDPEPVRAELETTAVLFFFAQRQTKRVTVEGQRLVVHMARAFDCDVRSPGELRAFELCNHRLSGRTKKTNLLCRLARSFSPNLARGLVLFRAKLFSRGRFRAQCDRFSRFLSRSQPLDHSRSWVRDSSPLPWIARLIRGSAPRSRRCRGRICRRKHRPHLPEAGSTREDYAPLLAS